jgi:hypothetical protein
VVEGAGFEIRFIRKGNAGSNPVPSARFVSTTTHGEMTEWSKVRDWKSRVPKGTGGSNPFLSASQT